MKSFFYSKEGCSKKWLGGLLQTTKAPNRKTTYLLGIKVFSKSKPTKPTWHIDLLDESRKQTSAVANIQAQLDDLKASINSIAPTLHTLSLNIETVSNKVDYSLHKADLLMQKLNFLSYGMEAIKYIYLPAQKVHSEVFSEYRGLHQGKDIVVVASGPTLNDYQPIKDAIHIGVNNTYKSDLVELDYLFVQDGGTIIRAAGDDVLLYRENKCQKFFGMHYLLPPTIETSFISLEERSKSCAKPYYFISHLNDEEYCASSMKLMSPDITLRPLNTWSSVIFPALEFALFTRPKRIYLVGCDCINNGYFTEQNSPLATTEAGYEHMYSGWKEMKKFIIGHYPDIELISVNPRGLKGLFKDIVTTSPASKNQDHPTSQKKSEL